MEWLNETYQVLIAGGLLLAAIDIMVLGFSTFFLTIIGLAMVVTGLAIVVGIIPDTKLAITLSLAILSALFTLALYKPLRALQAKGQVKPNTVSSDLVGLAIVLEQDLAPSSPVVYHYSGIDWKLRSSEKFSAGATVFVIRLEVGEMFVAAQPLESE